MLYVYMLQVFVRKIGGRWRKGYGPTSRRRCGMYGKTEFYYTGMTGNPNKRFFEHQNRIKSNFLSTFDIEDLSMVYVEEVGINYSECLKRESQIKKLSTAKKVELINSSNNLIQEFI